MCAGLLALSTGCPDPQAKFDSFLDRTEEDRGEGGGDLGGALADITGTFLLAVSTTLDVTKPLQFMTTTTLTLEGEGGTLDMDLQPLSLDVGETLMPRLPVGDLLEIRDVPVSAEGSFTIDTGEIMVTGMANPLTGSDIVAALVLEGFIQDADLFCGNANGQVISPIDFDLTGSTFGAMRIEPTDLPDQPTMFPVGCEDGGGTGTGG